MGSAPLEIERVWRLRGPPIIPPNCEIWKIEQGYLPVQPKDASEFAAGRGRRIESPSGAVRWVHTVKRGGGLVRQETEHEIDEATFDSLWQRTIGRRIRKKRFRFVHHGLTWELDQFLDWPLWMVEVELPTESTPIHMPEWLAPLVADEVTNQPEWRNFSLATRGPPSAATG